MLCQQDASFPGVLCRQTDPVCENVSPLCVDDEARGLARNGGVCVEGARLAEVDGHDALDDRLDGVLPLGRVVDGSGDLRGHKVVDVHARRGRGRVVAGEGLGLGLGLCGGVGAVAGARVLGLDLLHGPLARGRGRLLALGAGVVLAMVFRHGARGEAARWVDRVRRKVQLTEGAGEGRRRRFGDQRVECAGAGAGAECGGGRERGGGPGRCETSFDNHCTASPAEHRCADGRADDGDAARMRPRLQFAAARRNA